MTSAILRRLHIDTETQRGSSSLIITHSQRAAVRGALLLLLATACRDSKEGTTQPSIVTASISVALSSGAVSVAQGQSRTVTVTTTRVNYAGAIELTAEGAPNGVMVGLAPATLPDGTNSSVLTIAAAATASPGLTNITIRAIGKEVADGSTTLSVTVTPPPGISVAAPVAGVSVTPGVTDFTPVTITRSQYTAPVVLTVSGLPAGVFATVAEASVAGSATTIAISATAGASVGTSTVTITAQGTGVASATTTFPLTVNAPTGTAVQFRYCGVPAGTIGSLVPVWVAAQSGTNPWRQLTREAGETYNASFGFQGGIVAVYQTGADRYSMRVRYGTLTELQALAARSCTAGGTKPHTGSVAGVAAGEVVSVTMGASTALITAPATAFSLSNLADNAMDLAAVRRSATSTVPLEVIVRRALTLPFNSVLTLDFDASEAFDPIQKQATVANLSAGEVLTTLSNVRTSNGTEFLLGARTVAAGATSGTYDALPSGALVSGDVQSLTILAGTQSGTNGTSRYVRYDYRDAVDRAATPGALLDAPSVTTISPQPALRMRASGNRSGDYGGVYSVVFNQVLGNTIRDASIEATGAYLGSGATYTLDMPDFSQVSGWKNAFGFQGSTAVAWAVGSNDWTGAPKGFTPVYTDGVQLKGSERVGSTTP